MVFSVKKILIMLCLFALLPNFTLASDLTESLSGRILLEVEGNGEAWYVNPLTSDRLYLGRPLDAFNIMKKLGLGITNENLNRILNNKPKENIGYAKRFSGRILLQVEEKGEAWFINPSDLKAYYLGRPDDAFGIMRKLGLGIKNKDLAKIKINSEYDAGYKKFKRGEVSFRGVNVESWLSGKDIDDFAKLNGNLLRVNFSNMPLMNKEEPYSLNEDNLAFLDWILEWCKNNDIKVVIDPHTYPGTKNNTHTVYDDELWNDFKYQELLIRLWRDIARRYKGKENVISGYDLVNEPFISQPLTKNTPSDYNFLIRRLIDAIREIDPNQTIIVSVPQIKNGEGVKNRIESIDYLELPSDSNLVVETHMYEPHEITHQFDEDGLMPYPGYAGETFWDYTVLENVMIPLNNFSVKNNIPVFLGEFSAARWMGDDGNRYVDDIIKICEKNNWSWAYHSYRSSQMWDPEMSNINKNDYEKYPSTERLELLKSYFSKN